MAIAQECIHLIHVKKLNVVVMKVDLQKAYDCLEWGYLRMVLHKIGFQARCVEWIMACVMNVRYVVFINGYPTCFFGVGQGLTKGCTLSPLLFILAMDGLELHIKKVVVEGNFGALVLG